MSENDNTPTSTLTLRSPADLLFELPGLLGYRPNDSLVVIFTKTRTLRCVLRMDLTDLGPEAAIRVVSIAHRAEADTVHAVVYVPGGMEEKPHATEVESLRDLLDEAGVHVAEVLLVADGRYSSYLCTDVSCCPPEGRPVPEGTPVLEAERVRAGHLAVAGSREEAAAAYRLRPDLEPSPDALRTGRVLLSRTTAERGRVAVEAVRTLVRLQADGRLGLDLVDDELDQGFSAALMLLVQDISVRDLLLGTLATEPGSLSGPVEALTRTTVSSPADLRPRVAATAAALLAAHGDNPIAFWCMVDLAEDESLAALVRSGVELGLPPDAVRETFADALPLVLERAAVS